MCRWVPGCLARLDGFGGTPGDSAARLPPRRAWGWLRGLPAPLAPEPLPGVSPRLLPWWAPSCAVTRRSCSRTSLVPITRTATGAVSYCGSVLCTPAPDQTGLSLLLPSCRDVGRMNLIRYSSIQTSHRRSIAVISASFNAQRDKITKGMLLLFLTLYFSFITRVRAFVPNAVQAAFEISDVAASSCTASFPFFFRQSRFVSPFPKASAPGRLRHCGLARRAADPCGD